MFKRYVFIEGLTSLLGSNGKVLINNNGQIKDIQGNDLSYGRDSEGHKTVHCSGWDGERTYRVIDLVALQFKGLMVPESDYDKVRAFVIDGNVDNTHASNVGYRFTVSPLPYAEMDGFFYVPGYPRIAISRDGDVLNLRTKKLHTLYVSKGNAEKKITGGYKDISTRLIEGSGSLTLGRHRALCLTFKEFPDNVDSLVVNHKNGVPGDDWLDNLEWTTRKGNNSHAYAAGLRTQNRAVLVRNVRTGEIKEYYSLGDCSRESGNPKERTLQYRVSQAEFGQVFEDGTQIKFKDDPRPWRTVKDPDAEIKSARQKVPVKVRDCKSLSIDFYETITMASQLLDISRKTIEFRLNTKNASPLFGYQFIEADDEADFPEFTQEEYERSLKPNSFEIEARNLLTDEIKTFKSEREASRYFDFRLDVVLGDGKQPLLKSGWQIKFSEDPWIDSSDFDEQIYKAQKEVMARHEESGDITITRDAAEMAKLLGLDRKSVRKAAYTRGNQIYSGYRFRLGASTEPWPDTQIVFKTRS